jgi:acylphosphatase
MSDVVCARLSITGRVQGVWYRASTREAALALGLVGTVRNRADGSVLAIAQGLQPAVDEFIAWCRRGPPQARVQSVELEWIGPDPLFLTFTIAR